MVKILGTATVATNGQLWRPHLTSAWMRISRGNLKWPLNAHNLVWEIYGHIVIFPAWWVMWDIKIVLSIDVAMKWSCWDLWSMSLLVLVRSIIYCRRIYLHSQFEWWMRISGWSFCGLRFGRVPFLFLSNGRGLKKRRVDGEAYWWKHMESVLPSWCRWCPAAGGAMWGPRFYKLVHNPI